VASIIRNSDSALGVIPSGTFNHFAKDAGIPLDFEEAVLNLVKGQVSYLDYGSVNDRIFLNNSSIGQYPVAVLIREAARKRSNLNKKFAMVLSTIKTSIRYPLITITVDEAEEKGEIKTPLVFIGNNYYDISPLNIGKRNELTSGKLYAYGSRCTNIFCSIHLAFLSFFNQLKLSSKYANVSFTEGTISSTRKMLPVAADGEIFKMKTPLRYKMNHKALKVILPG
jgi:diacylglycerol kinase family enzyme